MTSSNVMNWCGMVLNALLWCVNDDRSLLVALMPTRTAKSLSFVYYMQFVVNRNSKFIQQNYVAQVWRVQWNSDITENKQTNFQNNTEQNETKKNTAKHRNMNRINGLTFQARSDLSHRGMCIRVVNTYIFIKLLWGDACDDDDSIKKCAHACTHARTDAFFMHTWCAFMSVWACECASVCKNAKRQFCIPILITHINL